MAMKPYELNIGDPVGFKYDVEQYAVILDINERYGKKEFTVRAFHGGYVDNVNGSVITIKARDCWIP